MRTLAIIVVVLLVLVLVAMAYVRFTPVDATSGVGRPDTRSVGDYLSEGGFYAVREASSVDRAALEAAILDTPRARQLADGVYVTRTAVWAFPDIIHVWEEDGALHVTSHLVYGRSDFAMNQERVLAWLAAAST
ncbi:MAG: DUF1499 domain-containing protein [Pseudomonadota bacterium]